MSSCPAQEGQTGLSTVPLPHSPGPRFPLSQAWAIQASGLDPAHEATQHGSKKPQADSLLALPPRTAERRGCWALCVSQLQRKRLQAWSLLPACLWPMGAACLKPWPVPTSSYSPRRVTCTPCTGKGLPEKCAWLLGVSPSQSLPLAPQLCGRPSRKGPLEAHSPLACCVCGKGGRGHIPLTGEQGAWIPLVPAENETG